jgi:preprotein translocase subunit SecD
VPGDADAAGAIGRRGLLYVRPVIHGMPADSLPASSTPSKPATDSDRAQRIADEKKRRQSDDQQMQILALQFQATRCGDDVLAGNDDPELPLITCSSDGQTVYLLGPSILGSAEVEAATATPDGVELTFDDAGTQVFADYTAAHQGDQIALTVDTSVDAAPQIQEGITEGRVMITAKFTDDQARALASTLANGPPPVELTVDSSETGTVAVERGWTLLRIWLAAAGVALVAAAIGLGWYVVTSRPRQT